MHLCGYVPASKSLPMRRQVQDIEKHAGVTCLSLGDAAERTTGASPSLWGPHTPSPPRFADAPITPPSTLPLCSTPLFPSLPFSLSLPLSFAPFLSPSFSSSLLPLLHFPVGPIKSFVSTVHLFSLAFSFPPLLSYIFYSFPHLPSLYFSQVISFLPHLLYFSLFLCIFPSSNKGSDRPHTHTRPCFCFDFFSRNACFFSLDIFCGLFFFIKLNEALCVVGIFAVPLFISSIGVLFTGVGFAGK